MAQRQELREGAHPLRAQLAGEATSTEIAALAGKYINFDETMLLRTGTPKVIADVRRMAASLLTQAADHVR
jgi:hypothetical protein